MLNNRFKVILSETIYLLQLATIIRESNSTKEQHIVAR